MYGITRRLHDGTRLGRLLRRAAGQPPRGTVVTIRSGRARGLRWRVGAGKTTAYWRGHYEGPVQEALVAALPPDGVVWDVGAHVGFFSGLAIVAGASRVVAVEPLAENLANLQRLVADNTLLQGRVEIVAAAVSDRSGAGQIAAGSSTSTGALGDVGQPVTLVTLDGLIESTGTTPDVVKIDVEGAEVRVLEGARRLLAVIRPVLLLAVHSAALRAACDATLAGDGYRCRPIVSDLLLCEPQDS